MRKWDFNTACRAALFLFLLTVTAGGTVSCRRIGYSRAIHSSLKAGPGYLWDDAVHIPVTYRLYRVPLGLRRFPDGGQSHVVHEATYILRIDSDRIPVVMGFVDHVIPDTAVAGVKVSDQEEGLVFRFPQIGSSLSDLVRISAAGVRYEGLSSAGSESWREPVWDINRTSRTLRKIPASLMGLPSPLDFGSCTPRRLMKDIIMLQGDFAYRREAIMRLNPDAREAEKILRRMDRHLEQLDGYKRAEYQMISRETRDVLIEIVNVK
ncbi:MAG: hypothetical protein PQJ58_12445 [Spirochaetales bacterium]|nr:hypothetical protein [Spirochaetales bacterium]